MQGTGLFRGVALAGSLVLTAALAPGFVAATAAPGAPTLSVEVAASAAGVAVSTPSTAPFAPGRLIVRFRGDPTFLAGTRATTALVPRDHVFLARNPAGLSVAAAAARYLRMPNVVYAEPDYVVTAEATPSLARNRAQPARGR